MIYVDLCNTDVERLREIDEKVVGKRAWWMQPLETDSYGLRLKPPDNNRNAAVAVLLRQYQRVSTRLGLTAWQPQNFKSNRRHFLHYLLSKYKNI